MSKVLALDLAGQTGWAVYADGMDRPHFGSWKIKRATGTFGEAGTRLMARILDINDVYGPLTDIVFEAQHMGDGINPQNLYLLIGMGFMCEYIAKEIGATVFSADIGTWRKYFMGRGSFKKITNEEGKVIKSARAQAKERSIDTCASYGWHVPDDNAADACGILDYYLSLLPKGRALPQPWRDANLMSGFRV